MQDINTEVALLKKEVSDIKIIFSRLDVAIEKITDVSSCVNRMLAVHEEKIANQEEAPQGKCRVHHRHTRVTFSYHNKLQRTHRYDYSTTQRTGTTDATT